MHIESVLKSLNLDDYKYTTYNLFSLILPDDFNYTKNGANKSQPIFKIYKGVLIEGTISKSIIGSSHNSIIQILNKEYNEEIALQFVNKVQFLAYSFLLYHGFTVGIADCIATKSEEITMLLQNVF